MPLPNCLLASDVLAKRIVRPGRWVPALLLNKGASGAKTLTGRWSVDFHYADDVIKKTQWAIIPQGAGYATEQGEFVYTFSGGRESASGTVYDFNCSLLGVGTVVTGACPIERRWQPNGRESVAQRWLSYGLESDSQSPHHHASVRPVSASGRGGSSPRQNGEHSDLPARQRPARGRPCPGQREF